MKTERESGGDFLNSVFILCLKYVIAMITKRSNGYVPYLYTQIKLKIRLYIKPKTGRGD